MSQISQLPKEASAFDDESQSLLLFQSEERKRQPTRDQQSDSVRAYASSEILSNDDITPSNRETEKEKSQSDGGPVPLRTFEINDILHNTRSFRSNKIDTSKYNIITFIPKNLIEQFSKLANIYFLLMMILQTIPQISITNGQPTILLPLMFVLIVSAVKDIFEDMKRHKSDNVENNRPVLKIDRRSGNFTESHWKHLRVGEVVKIVSDQYFPADLLLLKSSKPSGLCYVETKNLDGETNLKHKESIKEVQQLLQQSSEAAQLQGKIVCEAPNDYLYKFEGTLAVESQTYSLDHNNFLLRGSSLKNTEWVWGIVVYTGHDTKIMKNSSNSRSKHSNLEIETNKQIVFVFLFQVLICTIGSSFNVIWSNSWGKLAETYLHFGLPAITWQQIVVDVMTRFGTWFLLFANFVPISLMVTLEVVKFFQAMFIQWDIEIYDTEKDIPTKVQSSNLNEQLGQVKYVFSDKTGTLTCNIMEFKKMSIGKHSYGIDNRIIFLPCQPNLIAKCPDAFIRDVTNFNFQDDNFLEHLENKSHANHEHIVKMLTHLAICHTVVVETKDDKTFYNASSPDELALVNAAKYFGFDFKGRTEDNSIEVNINGKAVIYQLLNVIEFTSTRKRMTVIVKTSDNKIKVMTKGADSVIIPRLVDNSENKEAKDLTNQYLECYAKMGLRTLLLGEKEISDEEYAKWLSEYKIAQQAMKKREEKVEAVADQLEQEFELIGSTAIEDKLQDDVDKAISSMKKAGIKVWVLTGDKTETAINIGFSCQLLNEKMELYIIDATSRTDVLSQIADCRKMQINSEGLRQSATIVSGESLFKITSSERITQQFLKLACSSQVLLACRMSPKQKADIVRMIQKYDPKATTLAIGDGANDVNMITAAHIGVGISGVEGQQAVSASDYAIGQFKFLKNLLFVHGREAYRRNSYMVCFTFYKNLLFVMPQFWFGFYSGFSGQVFYDKWIYQIFNIVFTAVPVMLYALFDFQHHKSTFMMKPKLYDIGLNNECFSTFIFWKWLFYGITQSILVFYISFITFNWSPDPDSGRIGDLWMQGTFAYGAIVILANVRIAYDSYSYYKMTILSILISIGSFFVVFYLMNIWEDSVLFNEYYEINSYPTYGANLFIFFFIMYPIDSFLYFVSSSYKAEKEAKARRQRHIDKLRFTKGLDPQKLAPLHKYRGYAFSGEAGHTPQIINKLAMATRKLIATQQILQAMRQ